jgi:glycerol-3-phosphate dehydrogenase
VTDIGPDQTPCDLIIIGGGIVGCGIARDAALRGLSVVLLEQKDLGSGTTSGSTRLIHGGLRYLETADFKLVRLDLREREILLRIAPHLVKPLPFLLPLPRSWWGRQRLRIGMRLYDWLSYDKSLPNHRIVGPDELRQLEPALDQSAYAGAALFYDAQCQFPERLALENATDAAAHGAEIRTYTEVREAIHEGDRVVGVRAVNALTGEQRDVRARLVVNASGPWFDDVATKIDRPHPPRVRKTKGIHIACEPCTKHALVLESAVDGRVVFAIPWNGYTWIGTTDTDYQGDPGQAAATEADVHYLIESLAPRLPAIRGAKKYWTGAGVRALVLEEGSESDVSRMHEIATKTAGLVSVIGGKLTGYRQIAEEVVDAVCGQLGHPARCTTSTTPLPGARAHHDGGETHPLAARIADAVRRQWCASLEDFLLRRSALGFAPDRGAGEAEAVAQALKGELGWSEARRQSEVAAYLARAAADRRMWQGDAG